MRRARQLGAEAERERLRTFSGVGRVTFSFTIPEHEGVVQYAADIERALIQTNAERMAAQHRLEELEAELTRRPDEVARTAVLDSQAAHEALDVEIRQLQDERLAVDRWLERAIVHSPCGLPVLTTGITDGSPTRDVGAGVP